MSNENDICSICYEDFDNTSYILECNHKFHTNCIIKWFRNNNSNCPLCNDIKTYSSLSWYEKITTIGEIKKLGRRQDCPIKLKKILNKIKKKQNEANEFKKYCSEFKQKNKEVLKTFENLRKKKFSFNRKIKKLESELYGYIIINPIYIRNKK